MTPDTKALSYRYCGRLFTTEEIDWIRRLIDSEPKYNRVKLSRSVCDELGWLCPNGQRKEMSCRVAMLRMEQDGLLVLPPPQKRNRNGHIRPRLTCASDPAEPITLGAGALGDLTFSPVATPHDSRLWNELIERYHYLGYKPLPGAQMRYLVFAGSHLLAALGFGAAAWKVAPRDLFIGWSPEQRTSNLHLVVNNARFLILPWVTSRNLASRILSGVAKQLPQDWEQRYHYRPLLLETFVEKDRFTGASYRAANWTHVGQTQGRGKLSRTKSQSLPLKEIFLYPLHRHFRQQLCESPQTHPPKRVH
jgi:hypothetical protein